MKRTMIRYLVVVTALLSASTSLAQLMVQTIIFARHAEVAEDGSADPALSEAGQRRAYMLAAVLAKHPITQIISTPTTRTLQTAAPTAMRNLVEIKQAKDNQEALALIKNTGYRETTLVVGHSNTIPQMIKELHGPDVTIEHDEYNHLFIVTLLSYNELQTIDLTYGAEYL